MEKLPGLTDDKIFFNNNTKTINGEHLNATDLFNLTSVFIDTNTNTNTNYISGEKIQLLTDLFITTPHFLCLNPNITINHPKALDINNINSNFDNPKFIYSHAETILIFKEYNAPLLVYCRGGQTFCMAGRKSAPKNVSPSGK